MGDKGFLNRYQMAEDYNRVNTHMKTAFVGAGKQGQYGGAWVRIPAEVIVEMEVGYMHLHGNNNMAGSGNSTSNIS